jgi:hypothetical protein
VLSYLYLSNNELSGPFPTSINQAPSLYYMEAANNRFTSLPSTIGHLKSLASLNFNNNSLASIPTEAGFRNMTGLRMLYLNSNRNLNGPLPTWWSERSSQVSRLDLSGCSFTGGIPAINSTYIQTLILSDNALDGSIGPIIMGAAVQYFLVDRNLLTGPIPASIGTPSTGFVGLRQFDVAYNRLTGSIPPSFGNILGDLEVLSFNNNGIGGLLPNLALAYDLEIIRGHNTNIRLCDVNPGIPNVDSCTLYDVNGFGSCGCSSWYTRCTTNSTCPAPDYVAEPESTAPSSAPTPIATPGSTPNPPPGTPPAGSNPTSSSPSGIIEPGEPTSAASFTSAGITVAVMGLLALLAL